MSSQNSNALTDIHTSKHFQHKKQTISNTVEYTWKHKVRSPQNTKLQKDKIQILMQTYWIKSVSEEYRCDEEYLEEFNKGIILQYPFLQAVLPWNRLDPNINVILRNFRFHNYKKNKKSHLILVLSRLRYLHIFQHLW